jgi:hypothetical protein
MSLDSPSAIASPTASTPSAATWLGRAPSAASTGPTIRAPITTVPSDARSTTTTITIATNPATIHRHDCETARGGSGSIGEQYP